MAASYTLIGNAPTIQVVAPGVSFDTELATIQTSPSKAIASIPVLKSEFDAGTAGPLLTTFADNIEQILSQGKAVGATGSDKLDTNGLQEFYVTFTVAYNPPGAPTGQVTTDVNVPIGLLSVDDLTIGQAAMAEAEALITTAYDNLVSLSQG